jgi:hypothetical protein
MIRRILVAIILSTISSSLAHAETVTAKYIGDVDLTPFQCIDVTKSHFIHRACYDPATERLLLQLGSRYHQYCGVDSTTSQALLDSDTKGVFYNTTIKGHFSCRKQP